MEFWVQIKVFLSHSFLDISLGRLLISLLIFLFIFIFRRLFLRMVFTYIRKITSKTKSDVDDRIIDIFEVPARFFMGVVALWAAIEYMQLPEDAAGFINHVIRSLFAISFGTELLAIDICKNSLPLSLGVSIIFKLYISLRSLLLSL